MRLADAVVGTSSVASRDRRGVEADAVVLSLEERVHDRADDGAISRVEVRLADDAGLVLASAEGRPMVNVFSRAGGAIHHTWGAGCSTRTANPGQDPRHVGTLEPLWNMFDLIPEGRGVAWEEQLAYRSG